MKAEKIGLSCNIVFNIAIDAKAFELIKGILNKDSSEFINLTMGKFQSFCISTKVFILQN